MKSDTNNLQLDIFLDTDSAGLFPTKDKQDSISVKSSMELLINFGGAPILRSSMLQ